MKTLDDSEVVTTLREMDDEDLNSVVWSFVRLLEGYGSSHYSANPHAILERARQEWRRRNGDWD